MHKCDENIFGETLFMRNILALIVFTGCDESAEASHIDGVGCQRHV